MTANWENFEWSCTEYLNIRFGYYAKFIHQGGLDSTVPDILASTDKGERFYIEAKLSPAQCGQFVLLPDIQTGTFVYSEKNKININKYSAAIVTYMNRYFDDFREAGTAGKSICMADGAKIFSNWIIQAYEYKGVRFFMTNDFMLLPIENFQDYFDVAATYRVKRSGSSDVGKKLITPAVRYIVSRDYGISNYHINKNKLFVNSCKNIHNQRFVFGGNEFMFSKRNESYEVRKLSNTYNANVIFSISLKQGVSGLSDKEFIACLNR